MRIPRAAIRLTAVLIAVALIATAQDRSDWQSLIQIHPGDRVRLTLKSRTVSDAFAGFTPEQVTVGSTIANRTDVLKLERYGHGGWSRGKKAAVGAGIGGAAGAGIGAAAAGCETGSFGPCVTRAGGAAIVGALGAVIGALVGALLPHRGTDVIYAAKK